MSRLYDGKPADPAAGAEVIITVPTAKRWRLVAIRFRLVTSATAASRQVTLIIDDGTNVIWRKLVAATQTAGLTRNYLFTAYDGRADDTAFDANNEIKIYFPTALTAEASLPAAYRMLTST